MTRTAANIIDPFPDLLAPLTREERQALTQRLADHFYLYGRPPTRADVTELIRHQGLVVTGRRQRHTNQSQKAS